MEKRKINVDKDEKHWLSMIPVVVVLVSLFSYAVITSKNTRQSQKTDYETYENLFKIDEKKCYSTCS